MEFDLIFEAIMSGHRSDFDMEADKEAGASGYTVGPLYHGTASDFTVFDMTKTKPGVWGRGFYFAESEREARMWGANLNPGADIRIVKVYINPGRTLDIDDMEEVKPIIDKYPESSVSQSMYSTYFNDWGTANFHRIMKDEGVDSLTGTYYDQTHWVVYDPKRIKLADSSI